MSRLLFQQFLFGLLSVSLCTGRKHQHVRADTSSATISELQDQVVHSEVLAERDLVWQLPPHGPPRGLLLLFHGCSHSAGDFFMDCTDRSACLGLPEERLIVTASQRKENNWVAVAVSSGNREHRCWNKGDLAPVLEIVRTLQARLYLEAAPVFALGASSGGGFAGMLAAAAIREGRPLQAVCIQIMRLSPSAENVLTKSGATAVEFVTMSRDTGTDFAVQASVRTLSSNPQLASNGVRQRSCSPQRISTEWLVDRTALASQPLSPPTAAAIVKTFVAAQLIDSSTGLLLEDPRESSWREALSHAVPSVPGLDELSLVPDESSLSEVLNVAWALHEMCASDVEGTMAFFRMHANRKVRPSNE